MSASVEIRVNAIGVQFAEGYVECGSKAREASGAQCLGSLPSWNERRNHRWISGRNFKTN